MSLRNTLTAATLAAVVCVPAQAADEKKLGATVEEVKFSASIANINLGLRNMAAIKTVAARRLTVTGPEPQRTIQGIVACRQGATITGVRAVAGRVISNNGTIFITQTYGATPRSNAYSGQRAAAVSLPLTVKVSRTYNKELVDLSFNPARSFENKLTNFVNKGGSAAQYLRQSEAFDINVPINLIVWCKMANGANSVLAGEEYGGFVRREVPATILYNGDPAIVDGIGVVSATSGSGGTVAAPKPPAPPKRAPPPPPKRAATPPKGR